MASGSTAPLLADASSFPELPEGCGNLIDTSGPPGLLKRAAALVVLLGTLIAAWLHPWLMGCTLAVVLACDFAILVRFRRQSPRGPRCQQTLAPCCSRLQHAVTLLHLKDEKERIAVLCEARRVAASSAHTRLVFAGRPQLNSSRSPKLTGDLCKDKATPWHLALITEHRTGADYEVFSRDAGLTPSDERGYVLKRWVAGFRPPTRMIYPLLPLIFDVLGVIVRLVDVLIGRAPQAAFKLGKPNNPPMLKPLLSFLEPCQTDPDWAWQPFIMLNIMKPAASEEGQAKDKHYMIHQFLMFSSALKIRPFLIQIGSINKLTEDEEDPWFENIACMFHPSAVWMHRLLNSVFWESVGQEKTLGDMETILLVPLDIANPTPETRMPPGSRR